MIRLDWIAYESNQVDLIAGTIAAGVLLTRICQFKLESILFIHRLVLYCEY